MGPSLIFRVATKLMSETWGHILVISPLQHKG